MSFQTHLRTLDELARKAHQAGWIEAMPSLRESVHVAVIGEIKRGKSTFLNALMGEKVFPSRSSVCTTAVTFLEDGPPTIQAIYKPELNRPAESRPVLDGEKIFDCLQEMVAKPNMLGKKGNPNARDLDSVVVTYPNRFATDGVRLVDTPGVNDPEAWREEITFQFLPQVDAALMLLDPQQPLSKSEMDFLQNRATKAVKDQLLIVVSRSDEVKPTDLDKSVARIRRELEPLLPNLRIFTVASKPALEAKQGTDPIPETWQTFEESLDAFLHRGKAGALLMSRAQGIHDQVSSHLQAREMHMQSLSRASDEEKDRLDHERLELERIRQGVSALRQRAINLLASRRERLISNLERFLASQRSILRGTQDESLSPFTSRFLRDLQEAREAWLQDLASELETVLREEVASMVGKETSVRSFRIPSLSGLHPVPTFSAPEPKKSSSLGVKLAGGLLGSILFGPILGAGIGLLAGHLFNSDDTPHIQAAYAAFRRECESFLDQSTTTARQDVECLLRGMETDWIPHFFEPLEVEVSRQTCRVSESQADLGKSEQERDAKRQALSEETSRLGQMLGRLDAFLGELRAAGKDVETMHPATLAFK